MSKNVTTFEVDMELKVLSKSKAKELKGLSIKKERDREGLFLAEGNKCVNDTLEAFDLAYLIATKDWIINNSLVVKNFEKELYVADKKTISIISSYSSLPEVIAVFKLPVSSQEIPVLENDNWYILLDEIQDPGNLGTIIRTCDWFGVYNIYASKNTVDVYGPKVVQSTMGSLSRVKVNYLDLEELILKNRKLKLIGTLLNGVPVKDFKSERGGLILMGNEGKGISENLKQYINEALTIPPLNPISHPDSLNVAIATGIVLSHIIK